MSLATQKEILEAISTEINSSVSSLCGVNFLHGEQDTALPFCSWQIVADEVLNELSDGCSSQEMDLQVKFQGKDGLGVSDLMVISDTLWTDINRKSILLEDQPSVGVVSAYISGSIKGIVTNEQEDKENILVIRQEYVITII